MLKISRFMMLTFPLETSKNERQHQMPHINYGPARTISELQISAPNLECALILQDDIC
jgi:hypothetical protein